MLQKDCLQKSRALREAVVDQAPLLKKFINFSQLRQLSLIFRKVIFREIISKLLKAIGNAELESKFAKGIELIKRDIVFAASLYL